MKRILPLILTVLLLPALLAVPVMADDILDNNWVEILDFSTANDSGSNRLILSPDGSTKTRSATFVNPNGYSYGVGEILFSTDDSSPEISVGGSYITVTKVFGNTYRAYGNINTADLRVGIRYTDGTYLQIYSFRTCISRYDWTSIQVDASLSVYDNGGSQSWSFTGTPSDASWQRSSDDGFYGGAWSCTFNFPDWRKYDFIDIVLTVRTYSISTILADWEKGGLPYTVTDLVNADGSAAFTYLVIRIDLRSLAKSNSYNPKLYLSGDSLITDSVIPQYNTIQIESCIGYVQYENVDLLSYWFMQLEDWFGELISAVGGSNDASGVTDEINTAVGQLQQAGAALDSVQRPDLGKVDINVVGMVDPAGLTGVSSIVGLFTGNSLIYTIMLMFLTLALISYILFGKR